MNAPSTIEHASPSPAPRPACDQVPIVVAVTGHRNLVADEIPKLRELARRFLIELRRGHPNLPVVVMSPLAEGADRMVASVARDLGIPLIVPLPLPREVYAQDFKAPESLREFSELCAEAEVIELPLLPGDTYDSVASPGPRRDAHYARLGIYLCAHCHILLAIWDGKTSDRLGGTAQVVRFHQWDEMPGFTESRDSSPQVLAEDESDLVYHIVCSRDQANGAPAEGLHPLSTCWLTTDPEQPRTPQMPKAYRGVFERASEFNLDARRLRQQVASGGPPLLTGNLPGELAAALRPIEEMFRTADQLAIYFQARVTWALRAIYSVAALMGLTFVSYASVPHQTPLVVVFLLLFATGVAIHRVAEQRAWHRKYLDYRALAEGLRVQCYWAASGALARRTTKFAHDNFLQQQDVELGWIRNVMRYTDRLGSVVVPTVGGLQFAIREWVGEPHPQGYGQLAYYERKVSERTGMRRLTTALAAGCLWTGIAVAAVLAVFSAAMAPAWRDLLILLMGLLPMVAAVREAYAQKRAEKELIKQYHFMARIFRNARRQLINANGDVARRNILKALGDAALEEHAQWLLMHRERPLEHARLS